MATEYERKRLENIRRNEEMMAALKIQAKATQLAAATQQKKDEEKSYKRNVKKRSKLDIEAPTVVRRSLRARGLPPDLLTAKGIDYDESEIKDFGMEVNQGQPRKRPVSTGPVSMREVYDGGHSYKPLIERIVGFSYSKADTCVNSLDLESLSLEPQNIARPMPGKIYSLQFLPTSNAHIIAAGNKIGEISFWDIDSEDEEHCVYLYKPYSSPVSGIVFQPSNLSKMYSSCYEGIIRLLDVEKEVFDPIHSTDEGIFSLGSRPGYNKCVTFGDGNGNVGVFDERMGKCATSWSLHEDKINSIDYNLVNPHLLATSSTDRTVCIWDVRKIVKDEPKSLKVVHYKGSVQSAYFSPSGSSVAITSLGNTLGILSGANYEEEHEIYHFNLTGRWLATFKGIWGWDDSYVFIGNMKRGVDVVCTTSKKVVKTLTSEHMSAIPCRFAKHPNKVGMIAGATSGGQVYCWKSNH